VTNVEQKREKHATQKSKVKQTIFFQAPLFRGCGVYIVLILFIFIFLFFFTGLYCFIFLYAWAPSLLLNE